MQILDAQQTHERLPFPALIEALRAMFRTGCEAPPRHVHEIGGAEGGVSLIMPAWQPGGLYGVKTVNVFPGNRARGLPGLFATYQLFDATTGQPLALLDGNQITARRTAASSALAASFLAPANAHTLLVVGCGRVGSLLPEAYRAVRPIERVLAWNPSPEPAQRLAARCRALGLQAEAVTDLAAAAAQADAVACATLATEPLIRGAWLRPHAHLDLIGSFTPAMREADDDCWRGAAFFVDTPEALKKSGDLLGPLARGVIRAEALGADLAQLVRGEAAGRMAASGRTVFKSVGFALEDLAAAALAYRA